MAFTEQRIDLWSTWDHKTVLSGTGPTFLAPTWVPPTEQRRLAVYKVIAAQLANCARIYSKAPDADGIREYGDAALIVDRVAGAVLGDHVTYTIDGAHVPDTPAVPDPPAPAADGAGPLETRVAAVAAARWERDASAVVDAWEAAVATQPAAAAAEQWLTGWAGDEVTAVLGRAVHRACGFGDAVIVVAAGPDGAPTVTDVDPGFYFPAGPGRVHLAWEEEHRDGGSTRRFVRRLTWELVPVIDTYDDAETVLRAGDSLDDDGGVVRARPWDPDGPGSPVTCVFSDMEWRVEALGGVKLPDLSDQAATLVHADRVDLGIDIIPVVHVQGEDVGDDWGRSVLATVAQLLDDLATADTNIADAADLCAGPTVAVSGTQPVEEATVAPGAVWNLGVDGRMDVIDLSESLTGLHTNADRLQSRVEVNSQVPAEVLGRVGDAAALSGVAIDLRFGPFRQLVASQLRPSIVPALNRVLGVVLRFAQSTGLVEPGEGLVARVVPGPFLPSDLSSTVDVVAKARAAGIVSEEQAVHMLVAAGVDVADAAGEVARIRAADPVRAKALFEATGNEDAVAAWAGVEVAAAPDPEVGT